MKPSTFAALALTLLMGQVQGAALPRSDVIISVHEVSDGQSLSPNEGSDAITRAEKVGQHMFREEELHL
ncbi:MAG: hypothetical protein Q9208_006603 [Pyrenodesmia sp. 3 TL-2023]